MREIKFSFYNTSNKIYTKWEESNAGMPMSIFYTHDYLVFLQYTGLKDDNEKEIYEGDVVKRAFSSGNAFVGEVVFEEATYFIRNEEEYVFLANQNKLETLEVIGNIYGNPELLEGDSNV